MKYIFGLFVILFSTEPLAGFMTGQELLQELNAKNTYSEGFGLGYIVGIAENNNYKKFCFDKTGKVVELKNSFLRYMYSDKSNWRSSAEDQVTKALSLDFPCQDSTPANQDLKQKTKPDPIKGTKKNTANRKQIATPSSPF